MVAARVETTVVWMVVHWVACSADALAALKAARKAARKAELSARTLVVLMAGPRAPYLVEHWGARLAGDWAEVSAVLLVASKADEWVEPLAGRMALTSAGVMAEQKVENSAAR